MSFNLIKETVGLQAENQVLEIPLSEFKQQNPEWKSAPRYSQMVSPQSPAPHQEQAEAEAEEILSDLADEEVTPPEDGNRGPSAEGSRDSSRRSRRNRRNRNQDPTNPPGQ